MENAQNTDEGGKSVEHKEKINNENYINGKKAEDLFIKYLNIQRIPFYYIDQGPESFSDELHLKHIVRPDYIVHTKKGVFYVDVKYRSKEPVCPNGEERFRLKQDVINGLLNFQDELHSDVWVAFTDNKTPNFFYMPISEIYEFSRRILEEVNKNYSKEDKFKFKNGLIYIPEQLLYNCLSFDNGFYKKQDESFYKAEAKCHIDKSYKEKPQ